MNARDVVAAMTPAELEWAFWADCVDVSRKYAPIPCREIRAEVEQRLEVRR